MMVMVRTLGMEIRDGCEHGGDGHDTGAEAVAMVKDMKKKHLHCGCSLWRMVFLP